MLDALNFVRGSISAKTLLPEMQHVQIKDGYVTGYNGIMTLMSPIDVPFNAAPKAIPFIKAIETSKEEATIELTRTGRIKLTSGKMSAFIECISDHFFEEHIRFPEKTTPRPLCAPVVDVLRTLLPFVSVDASRPWSRGVRFCGDFALATNNIVIVEAWTRLRLPEDFVLPVQAAQEMVRIKQEPTEYYVNKNTIIFFYENGRCLQVSRLDDTWPDVSFFDKSKADYTTFPENFFENVKQLLPFLGENRQLIFHKDKMCTTDAEETGAAVQCTNPCNFSFNADQLLLLKNIASEIDFCQYPNPTPFRGKTARGIISGMVHAF